MPDETSPPGFLTEERRRLVEMLAERGVPFLVVGGEAIRAAGFHRLTKDLDLVVPRSPETIHAIKEVALEFGYRVPRATDLLVSSTAFKAMYLRLAPKDRDTEETTHHVDVLFSDVFIPDFETAVSEAIEIPENSGIRYASVRCLLDMKRNAVQQPRRSPQSLLKDKADIAFLEELWLRIGEEAGREKPRDKEEGVQ
jgi:hypothetical protein